MDTIKNWEIARQSLEWMKEKQNLNDQQVVTEILADMLGDSLNADIWIPTKTEIEPMKAK